MSDALRNDGDLNAAIGRLITVEPKFKNAYQLTGKIELRTREGGYSSLVRTIVGQQVSVAAATSIWNRLHDAGLDDLDRLKDHNIEELRQYGLSKQKATYLLALANANINFEALQSASDAEVIAILTAIKGVGLWTAEIYLMFAMGRADVIAAGDLALQESARILFKQSERPNEKTLRQMAQNWSPYQNAAAQLLWAYYHVMKTRDGIGA